MKKGSRFIALACVIMLTLTTFVGCVGTGAGVTPVKVDNFLSEHETLLKLGTQAAVIAGLRANPSYEKTVMQVSEMLKSVTFPADSVDTVKEMVLNVIDMNRFSITERLFITLLLDEFVTQLEMKKDTYCAKNAGSVVCLDQHSFVKTTQVYLEKFGTWLRMGVELHRAGSAEHTRSAFPVLAPLP